MKFLLIVLILSSFAFAQESNPDGIIGGISLKIGYDSFDAKNDYVDVYGVNSHFKAFDTGNFSLEVKIPLSTHLTFGSYIQGGNYSGKYYYPRTSYDTQYLEETYTYNIKKYGFFINIYTGKIFKFL